jgi:hypothetical protein
VDGRGDVGREGPRRRGPYDESLSGTVDEGKSDVEGGIRLLLVDAGLTGDLVL